MNLSTHKPPVSQADVSPGVIDLGTGNPDITLLPFEELRRAAELYFASGDSHPLQYGLEQGNSNFRHALANFLTFGHASTVDHRSLLVTAGASSALDLLCTVLTHPGECILVEEPSYFLAMRIFEDHGLRTDPILMDHDGICLDALEERVKECHPRFIYIVPTFQNPSGRTLPVDRRIRLIELSQKHDFLIVADEVYHFLAYSHTPPPSFATFAHEAEQVISLNSFSKILAPGLRLGWIQAHGNVIKRLVNSGLIQSGGGMNPFTSAILRFFIESGVLSEHIDVLRREYSYRLNTMNNALHQHLPSAEWLTPEGGFFFWVRLPDVDATQFRRRALEFNVDFRPGAVFSSGNKMRDYIRLSFSSYDPIQIDEGINRLSTALR